MLRKRFALCLTIALLSACGALLITLTAQALPVTKTVSWDPNPLADAVINYVVTLDGATIGSPTGTSQPFVITTTGPHVLGVTAVNAWGSSAPASLNFTVSIPGKSTNLKIQ